MLLTLEGLDGSGKTTCWEHLRETLGERGDGDPDEGNSVERGADGGSSDEESADGSERPALTFTREPTDSWYGEAVAQSIAADDADPLAELFLYTADHAAHLARTVRPALAAGEVVVSDRYSDSRYAYQGVTLADRFEDALAFVRGIHEPWTRPPDATIYLDVDPETGARRSGATNKFESTAHLEAVQANYERLIAAEPERFVRVDATRPVETVQADVREAVEILI